MKFRPYGHQPRAHRVLLWTVDRFHPVATLFGGPGVDLKWHAATLLFGSGGMVAAGLTIAQGVIEDPSWITAGMGILTALLFFVTLLSWWLARILPVQEDWKEARKKAWVEEEKERTRR